VRRFNGTGGVVDARYFDTYAFRSTGMEVAGRGYPAGSRAARGFYGSLSRVGGGVSRAPLSILRMEDR
jgi:hypothetical protein